MRIVFSPKYNSLRRARHLSLIIYTIAYHACTFAADFGVRREVTVENIDWIKPDFLPRDIEKSSVLKDWIRTLYGEPIRAFAEINTDCDKSTREILIASSYGGSGGRNFLLISKRSGQPWREGATIFGAPVFVGVNRESYALQVYYRRHGEMFVRYHDFNNYRYRLKYEKKVPTSLIDECFYRNWQRLNLFHPVNSSVCQNQVR